MTHSICQTQAQAVELYGLDLPLMAPETIQSIQTLLSRPNLSIVHSRAYSEASKSLEVML